jgi:hypothetical protein
MNGYSYVVDTTEGIVRVYEADGTLFGVVRGDRIVPVLTEAQTAEMLRKVLRSSD